MKTLTIAAALMVLAGAAHAEVVDKSAAGFEVRETASIAAPPAKVYAALLKPSLWWNSAHSWSGSAKNLSIDVATGCFCETMPNGGLARHMTVVYADGVSQLRMSGALGPLQFTGATGHLGAALKEQGGKTALTLTYDVGGYAKGGLADTLAAPVDQVLGEQVARLKKYVETGKPD
jgi:hypothetical protein